jgi:hypothetical protein
MFPSIDQGPTGRVGRQKKERSPLATPPAPRPRRNRTWHPHREKRKEKREKRKEKREKRKEKREKRKKRKRESPQHLPPSPLS